MKKTFEQPELEVVRIYENIGCQDIIVVSNTLYEGDDVRTAGRRFEDWDAGY